MVEEKDHYYCKIIPKEWIDLLRALESKDDRRRVDCKYQNNTDKKNKYAHHEEADINTKESPRVPYNKHKLNPIKGKTYNSTSHQSTHNYCVIFNKEDYLECRYKYHYSEKYNIFDPIKTKKDLNGRLVNKVYAVNQFHKTKKYARSYEGPQETEQDVVQNGQEDQLPPWS